MGAGVGGCVVWSAGSISLCLCAGWVTCRCAFCHVQGSAIPECARFRWHVTAVARAGLLRCHWRGFLDAFLGELSVWIPAAPALPTHSAVRESACWTNRVWLQAWATECGFALGACLRHQLLSREGTSVAAIGVLTIMLGPDIWDDLEVRVARNVRTGGARRLGRTDTLPKRTGRSRRFSEKQRLPQHLPTA
eukprot:190505-Chlamydomonas_euryale.AAC.1